MVWVEWLGSFLVFLQIENGSLIWKFMCWALTQWHKLLCECQNWNQKKKMLFQWNPSTHFFTWFKDGLFGTLIHLWSNKNDKHYDVWQFFIVQYGNSVKTVYISGVFLLYIIGLSVSCLIISSHSHFKF